MYKIMFVSGLLCFGFFFLISLILFVKNDIGTIMGELTGLRAKRTIRKMLKIKSEKAQAMKESHLGEGISVRTSELMDDMIKKDSDEKTATEYILTQDSPQEEQPDKQIKERPESVLTGFNSGGNGQSEGSVFEAEEEMTVLGGEAFKRVSSKNSVEDVTYEAENLDDPETGILSNAKYLEVLQSTKDKVGEARPATIKGERTRKRMKRKLEKEKEIEMAEKETDTSVLQNENETSMLQEDVENIQVEEMAATGILEGEEATGILLQKGE